MDASQTLSADISTVASDGTVTFDHTNRVAGDVVDMQFAYRDGAGVDTTVPSEVRDVTLTLERTATDTDDITWTTDLHLRNGGLSCGF